MPVVMRLPHKCNIRYPGDADPSHPFALVADRHTARSNEPCFFVDKVVRYYAGGGTYENAEAKITLHPSVPYHEAMIITYKGREYAVKYEQPASTIAGIDTGLVLYLGAR
jgi:hypothetical protein